MTSEREAVPGGTDIPQAPRRLGGSLRYAVPACLVISAVSLLLPSTLTYDPWSWLIWAREILRLDLVTDAGPSWKPLPVAFDIVFAMFGRAAPYLWLIVARAGGLLALVIAYRLGRRLAGPGAGIVAAAGLALTDGYLNYLLPLGMSEPLLAALALLAFERHLDGQRLQACASLFGAALLRPEAWPFFGLYCLFLLFKEKNHKIPVILMMAALPAAWFLPEYIGSGDLLRSGKRAAIPTSGGAALSDEPALALLYSLHLYLLHPIKVGVVIWFVSWVARKISGEDDKAVFWLTVIGALWTMEIAILAQTKLASGEQRYLIVTAAAACVAGGVGFDRLVRWAAAWSSRLTAAQPRTRLVVGTGLTGLLVLASVPSLRSTAIEGSVAADQAVFESKLNRDLRTVIARVGGADRIVNCGGIATGDFQVPALTWELGVHFDHFMSPRDANVVFRARNAKGARITPEIEEPERFRELARQGEWRVLVTSLDDPNCRTLSPS